MISARGGALIAAALGAASWSSLPSSSKAANEAAAKARPVPFPAGTYVASLSWPVPPTVKSEEDRLVVELPGEGRSQVTCVVSGARGLGARSAVALARSRAELSELTKATVTNLAVAPQAPVIFMTLQRPNATGTDLAAFRDAETSFVCVSEAAGDPSVFRRVVTELATSIHPARRTTAATLVRLCRLSLDDGGVGFERWEVRKRGRERSSLVTASLAYRNHDGADLMELDVTEGIEPSGQVGESKMERMVGGNLQTHSVVRHRDGASYGYEMLKADGSTSGRFRTKDAGGLPSMVAIAERIKRDLIGGRARTFAVEIWDPFSPQAVPSPVTYSLDSRTPLTVDMAEGPRHSRQLVDDDGFVKRAETPLSRGLKLVSECQTLRGSL